MTCTADKLTSWVADHGGLLYCGAHRDDVPECCILEAVSLCEGLDKTDDPDALKRPDIRPLNDARWSSDTVRTAQMLRLGPLLEAWPTWDDGRRVAYVRRLSVLTVQRVIAELPGLPADVRAQCRSAGTVEAAAAAARSAAWSAAEAAADAAAAAWSAAYAAADAAAAAWSAAWSARAAEAAAEAAEAAAWSAARAAEAEAEADSALTRAVDCWVNAMSETNP